MLDLETKLRRNAMLKSDVVNQSVTNKKDHFVPQFLLRNFAVAKTGTESGLVYIYKKFDTPRKGSIAKHAGNEVDFYLGRHAETKEPAKVSDEVYKEIEKGKHAPAVVKKVLEQDGVLNLKYEDESILATLVAHQLTRTRKFRKLINKCISYLLLHSLISIDDLGNRETIQDIVVKNKYKITAKQIDEDALVRKSRLEGTRGQELFIAIQVAESIVEEIYRKTMHTIIAPKSHYFILSDAPVCIIGKSDDLLEVSSLWDFSRDDGYTFILPISPKKAIVFGKTYKPYHQISDRKLSESLAVMVNSLSVNNADVEFYSHTDQFWNDYKNDLITPARLASYRKFTQEMESDFLKRIFYSAQYLLWKLRKVFKDIVGL